MITEEEIARAILHEEYGCAPEDVPNLYGKALATARLVMALVHPAIERARVEERERILSWATSPNECAEPDEADDGSLCPTEEAIKRAIRKT